MKKIIFVMILIFILSACGVSREEHEMLASEVQRLQDEISKINDNNTSSDPPVAVPPSAADEPEIMLDDCTNHVWEFMYASTLTITMDGVLREVEGVDYHNHRCTDCNFEEPHHSLEACICRINHPCAIRHDYSIYFFTGALVDGHEYGHQCRRLCGMMEGKEDWERWWQNHDGNGKCSKCNFN